MAISVISQPPNDSFSFRLFYNLVKDYADKADIIYIWSLMLDPTWECVTWNNVFEKYLPSGELHYRKLLKKLINKDIVIICIKDHLTCGDAYNRTPHTIEYLDGMIDFYADKKFILFTSLENLDSYLNKPNLTIIPIGGDLTNQRAEYQKLNINIDKNFDTTYTFLNLNRQHRLHRTIILSTLYGLDLEEFGIVSCMFNDQLGKNQMFIENLNIDYISKGFEKLKTYNFKIHDSKNIYPTKGNDNVFNFKNSLINYYKNTFVEIVGETSFFEKSFLLTEKTLNCFYGYNFPIVLSSKGTVEFLRKIGLDMFDDIIDHTYDNIEDPVERIYSAVTSNKKLLTDADYVKNLWIHNKERFDNNLHFLKNDLYNFYSNRANDKFIKIKDCIWN
jgi:hypothetical protein